MAPISFLKTGKVTVSARCRDVKYQKYQDVTIRAGSELVKVLSGNYAKFLFYAYVDFAHKTIEEFHIIPHSQLKKALMAKNLWVQRNTDGATGFVTVKLNQLA